ARRQGIRLAEVEPRRESEQIEQSFRTVGIHRWIEAHEEVFALPELRAAIVGQQSDARIAGEVLTRCMPQPSVEEDATSRRACGGNRWNPVRDGRVGRLI